MSGHTVSFRSYGRIATCSCGLRWTTADDTSQSARQRVLDAAEEHAWQMHGTLDLAGMGPR
jgi:hypothetical protein